MSIFFAYSKSNLKWPTKFVYISLKLANGRTHISLLAPFLPLTSAIQAAFVNSSIYSSYRSRSQFFLLGWSSGIISTILLTIFEQQFSIFHGVDQWNAIWEANAFDSMIRTKKALLEWRNHYDVQANSLVLHGVVFHLSDIDSFSGCKNSMHAK